MLLKWGFFYYKSFAGCVVCVEISIFVYYRLLLNNLILTP